MNNITFFLIIYVTTISLINAQPENIEGEWIRLGHSGPIHMNFRENGTVEGDLNNDQQLDLIDSYRLQNDTIIFKDIEIQQCAGTGKYKIFQSPYYLAFDLINDDCGGRIKTMMGFWVKPEFKGILDSLNNLIVKEKKPVDYLMRGRMFMALGISEKAKADFDIYLKSYPNDARALINRAGTRFPNDLQGIIEDCSKAIRINQNAKNAWFLRGLALYSLGKKEEACENFSKAIELGFNVLKIAEKDKCEAFWE